MGAVLDFNEAPPASEGQTGETVDENVRYAKKLMVDAKLARSNFDKDWQTYRDYEKGKQFGRQRRARYKNRTAINICRSTIQAQVPLLTDSEPSISVQPKEPSDLQFTKMASEVMETWWKNNDMHLTMLDWIMDSQIVGTGIVKVTWNSDLMDGIGDVEVRTVNQNDFYVNNNAYGMTKQKGMRYSIERMHKPVGELKVKFPDLADKIKSDSGKPKDTSNDPASFNEEIELVSPVNQKSDIFDDKPSKSVPQDDIAEYWEIWEFNDTVEEQKAENEETKAFDKKIFKKKYPNGRLLSILPNQNLTLFDGENPYKDGEMPYVRLVDTQKPRQFWGEGEIEPLKHIQDLLNKTVNNIADYMDFTGNPVWYIHKRSGVNPNKITNRMGMVLAWDGERNDFRPFRDVPPALPAYYFEYVQTLIRFGESASGIQEVSQGRRPQGITSGDALDTLQEAAQTRVRLKERNSRAASNQLAKLVFSRIMQHYRENRVFKITNEEGWPEFFEFMMEEGEDGQVIATGMKTKTTQDEKGELQTTPGEPIESTPSKGFFDVEFQSGASLPFQKAQRQGIAFKLFENQVIDGATLLKDIEYPNAEELGRKFDEKQAQAEEEAAAQQQEGGL